MTSPTSTITRAALTEAEADAVPLSRADAHDLVDLLFDTIVEALEAGEDVRIFGFGRWSVREKRARPGRNPATGEPTVISARRVVSFRPSRVLRESMRGT